MYMINEFQLVPVENELYLNNFNKGVKISSAALAGILIKLKERKKLEISVEELTQIAESFKIDSQALINALMNQLHLIKPVPDRKFGTVYLNVDDPILADFLSDAFAKEYNVKLVDPQFTAYEPASLVLFYRANYSHEEFKHLYQNLPEKVCIITAGIVHKILIIDNLYYRGSGLPTHFSNFNNLLAGIHSSLSVTKNNWLLFYRSLMRDGSESLPDPEINLCQKGFVSYCLYKFTSQFTNFWSLPTTLDSVNWFWHVDLNGLNVFKEIAIHSPYSQYDMNLNLAAFAESRNTETSCSRHTEQELCSAD
ncbi:hypothetical protein [Legionella worsleiensis]|uniref:Uncharacterized protein n=1 Tax=Legionella worsleiensis TaxID=45076 RepID=A0A0W1A9I6_9GAMM|nr:hypothetical protein [Legionella worsleiensis]KTD77999.1 hypothetical protein Lwor_1881 [Legionella worsleiensis]STY31518.1 Uncharacterised protein [Legionella worsleiensis]